MDVVPEIGPIGLAGSLVEVVRPHDLDTRTTESQIHSARATEQGNRPYHATLPQKIFLKLSTASDGAVISASR